MSVAEVLPWEVEVRDDPRAQPRLSRWRWLGFVRHLGLPIALIVLILSGVHYVPIFRYEMNPDGCGYMNIAKQYLDGNFWDAVNAYWSPLISWLLIPFMAAGIDAPLASKIVSVIIGGGVICSAWWILRNAGVTRDVCFYVALTLVPIVMYFGMIMMSPDMLMGMAILLYLAQLTDPRYDERAWSGLATGFLMAFAYLAKAYALPFVVGHFCVVTIIQLIRSRGERKRIVTDFIAAMVVLLAIAGTWGLILGSKYGTGFTLGSTGRYNLAYNGPEFKPLHHYSGFMRLPTSTAISAWDDATYYDVPKWDPFGTPAEREHFRKNRLRNWEGIKKLTESFTWIAWPILLAGVLLAGSRGDPGPRKPAMVLVLALVMFPIGYYLLHVMERFLPAVCFLLLIIAAVCVGTAARAFHLGPVRRFLAMGLICLTFFHNAQHDPAKQPDWTKRFARWPLDGPVVGAEAKPIADGLAGLMPAGASFASNGPWKPTIYVSSWLDLRYHGTSNGPKWSPERIEQELRDRKIQHFWVWVSFGTPPFLNSLPELTGGKVADIRIYKLDWPATTQPATKPSS